MAGFLAAGLPAFCLAADSTAADTALVPAGSVVEVVLFYVVAGTAALCALGCVLTGNIVRMAVYLFGTLSAVAILYFLMAANFLAAVQLIVYAGGTLILIIFGVMLTSKSPWVRFEPRRAEIIAGGIVALTLFLGLVAAFAGTDWGRANPEPAGHTVAAFGRALLTTYLVPFELASVLLLAVMIGSAYLARVERK